MQPTVEQLAKINSMVLEPLSRESVYVFPDLLIDDRSTSYFTVVHKNLLQKFMQDVNSGIGLLMAHNNRALPIGRSFEASLRTEELMGGDVVTSLHGGFYIPLGLNIEDGLNTSDIVQRIDSGVVFDTSIGFQANSWTCSICGNDFFDYSVCSHYPGKKYVVNRDGDDVVETMFVILGEDGQGELIENSLVYAGASPRAGIQDAFDMHRVREQEKGTKLQLIDDLTKVSPEGKMYHLSIGGQVFLLNEKAENKGYAVNKRSEVDVTLQELQDVLKKHELEAETADGLDKALSSRLPQVLSVEDTTLGATEAAQLEAIKSELDSVKASLHEQEQELVQLRGEKEELEIAKDALEQEKEELADKAVLAETYRKDLMKNAMELGVRAQGNAFPAELYERFLSTLSIEDLKEVVASFEEQVKTRFGSARVSAAKKQVRNFEPSSREDFETEEEFRAYVAKEAAAYAKEHQVSVSEATKLIYRQFTQRGSEE